MLGPRPGAAAGPRGACPGGPRLHPARTSTRARRARPRRARSLQTRGASELGSPAPRPPGPPIKARCGDRSPRVSASRSRSRISGFMATRLQVPKPGCFSPSLLSLSLSPTGRAWKPPFSARRGEGAAQQVLFKTGGGRGEPGCPTHTPALLRPPQASPLQGSPLGCMCPPPPSPAPLLLHTPKHTQKR